MRAVYAVVFLLGFAALLADHLTSPSAGRPVSPEDFAGAGDRKIALPRMEGKWMTGEEYVAQFSPPNCYSHAVTAYAILRHNGVDLGKRDCLGSLPTHD